MLQWHAQIIAHVRKKNVDCYLSQMVARKQLGPKIMVKMSRLSFPENWLESKQTELPWSDLNVPKVPASRDGKTRLTGAR